MAGRGLPSWRGKSGNPAQGRKPLTPIRWLKISKSRKGIYGTQSITRLGFEFGIEVTNTRLDHYLVLRFQAGKDFNIRIRNDSYLNLYGFILNLAIFFRLSDDNQGLPFPNKNSLLWNRRHVMLDLQNNFG